MSKEDRTTMLNNAFIAVLAVLIVSLTGCTGGGGSSGSGQASKSSDGPYNCFTEAPEQAKVTLEVFTSPTRATTDENPAEKVMNAAEPFAGKVKCVLRPVSPFEQADALAAGKAILAAGEQGHAWAMYQYIKDHLNEMSDTFYVDAARQIGIDTAQFEKDFARDDFGDQVKINTQKTSQGHPLRRVQLDGEWAPCGTESLDCLGDKIKEKLAG
jgi:hypothetical protein